MTIHCQLVAKDKDYQQYQNLVFENLESPNYLEQYKMVVVFPNWESYIPVIGDRGYLTFKEVKAGEDCWYDGKNFIPYNYSNIIFIKFVKEVDNSNKDIIL